MGSRLQLLLESAKEVADRIKTSIDEDKRIFIVCHNDADALSACGIMIGALWRANARFIARSVNRIDEFFTQYDEGLVDAECILFLDMGSGYVDEISSKLKEKDVVIIDHHPPSSTLRYENIVHLNPHFHGVDGAFEVSASGLAYLVSKCMDDRNYIYAPIAIVGALGDMQDKNGSRMLRSVNQEIANEAKEKGVLEMYEDLILFGRSFKPIHVALANTSSPYLHGLSGREDACYSLVTSLGIKVKEGDKWRTLSDLTDDEKKKLYNGILSFLSSKGISINEISKELVGMVYELVKEERWTYLRDAREFSWLLNACGKTGNAWLGISIAAGSRGELLDRAQRLLEDYRAKIAKSIDMITRPEAMTLKEHIMVLSGEENIDERQVSSIASMLSSSGSIPQDKVLVVWAKHGENAKVSARASRKLVEKGLDLGKIISKAASSIGGRGGGHSVAAGADIPLKKLDEFLEHFDRLVGENVD